ncbi:CAF17-like 4Fe-4S cluster assembly/insertion protein YgfZ [Humibacter ginsenosidimutans]|uniref:Folate-binding protein YgfZ n=1 Tax=Humibacter ginsenosidimutans TaxID=2599293 RepID=A0A5B8M2A9_9MICO|nr:glycine cleavage T C-terminal barrel domain-containing protein [Humibacter ginsenosidimutans]QDZ14787.1 folate-binding protein YgfZ [Humibacter ginsenosidimutans]
MAETDPILPASPFLALPGAVATAETDPDAGVPAHYGSPLTEQRDLERGAAVVDLSTRGVVGVTGGDRLSWLDSMSSQSLRGLRPGESAEALLLDPHGHVEHALHVLDDGETTWLLLERTDAAAVLDFLQKMRFMLRVEPADRTADFATVGSFGVPDAVASLRATSEEVPLSWGDPWPTLVTGGHQYARPADGHPGADYRWVETLVPREALGALAAEVTAGTIGAAGTLAAEALRIAAWRPRFAADVDERTIPHELDWLRTAVHLNKGCYRGQETVAKVHNLGHPPRRMVFLHLDGSQNVAVRQGDDVLAGDAVVGHVTSAGVHHELGPIALAVVKRTTDASTDLVVRVDDDLVAAAQEQIVPTDAGAEANVPRIPRLGAVSRDNAVTREPRSSTAR